MKRKSLLVTLIACLALVFGSTAYADVATFDDLTLAPNSYWNGSDESGGFTSGDAYFLNYYDTGWGSWDGWAYSNMTDTTTPGWGNQFSAITGGGVNGSANYGVAYDGGAWGGASPPLVSLSGDDYDTTVDGYYFTNTTYAYLSMQGGDGFVDAFGSGDWQMMTITGIDSLGNYTSNTVDFYLADYTSTNSDDWYIVDEWTYVDMSGLGDIIGFEIDFSGSQVDGVPAYVAMDNVPVPAAVWLLGSGLLELIGIRRKTVK
jgi:hypothetical protein